jgi:hypothetical protein
MIVPTSAGMRIQLVGLLQALDCDVRLTVQRQPA